MSEKLGRQDDFVKPAPARGDEQVWTTDLTSSGLRPGTETNEPSWPCGRNTYMIRAMPGDLYYGDNLTVMRRHIAPESIDLIYLDPPFNSDRKYNWTHKASQSQHDAYRDTWTWDDRAKHTFAELVGEVPGGSRVPPELSALMLTLKKILHPGRKATLAYLSMMAIRLVEMRRVLRQTGALYIHCDPTESHYLKIVLDTIFGADKFENEIIWQRTPAKGLSTKHLPNNHDVILGYRKGEDRTWNSDAMFVPYDLDALDEKTLKKYQARDADGRQYQLTSLLNPNDDRPNLTYEFLGVTRVWRWERPRMQEAYDQGLVVQPGPGKVPRFKRYLDEQRGKPLCDVWTDIPPINSQAKEDTGYDTQKPLPLLKRILALATKPGELVLDPFCGCGTTIQVAQEMGRQWIGIDVAIRAVDVIKDRLDEKWKPRVWTEYGEPTSHDEAEHLADTNHYDFQWWAVRMMGGQPPKGEKKKGGDGGKDGEIIVRHEASGTLRRIIISVKGGQNLTPDFVRALDTTVRHEQADYGILVTMKEPSSGMRDVASDCGRVPWSELKDGKLGQRIRIVTVAEILAGVVKLPGKNETPRSQSSPPPPEARVGETLHLPFPTISKAKQRRGKALLPSDAPPPAEKRAKKKS